tara:strand:+ start:4175 stop:5857 length:1683 start_codon:yes stop_codon:yes gene_type:complete
MAELTANDIGRLLAPTNEGVRSLTIEQEQTTADIKSMHETISNFDQSVRRIGLTIDKIFTELGRVSKQIDKPPVIEDKKEDNIETKEEQDIVSPLETINNHLSDIKDFLVKTFTPTQVGLSGSTEDKQVDKLESEKKEVESDKEKAKLEGYNNSALAWLGGLFAVGALTSIGKTLGLGAAGGVAGGLLAKILPKIFPFGKAVIRRIPILGSLFSFYEAYKKFKQGGVDNIVFGLMDVAAGIAYAVPGVGTAIGIGLDVLQYFLKNKADEWKKETGETSFFGSLYDQVIEYLSETPIIKWMVGLGDKFSALFSNPSTETFLDLFEHLGSYFSTIYSTFKMLSEDAGAALGLTDESGNTQGLFEWLYDKIEEYVIDPVKGMFTSVFKYVGNVINGVQDSLAEMILGAVDSIPMLPDWVRDKIKGYLGLPTSGEEAEAAVREQKAAERGISEAPPTGETKEQRDAKVDAWYEKMAKRHNTTAEEYRAYRDFRLGFDGAVPSFEEWRGSQLKKVPEKTDIPKPDLDVELNSPPMSNNVQNNVSQTQINTYVAPEAPSSRPVYVA